MSDTTIGAYGDAPFAELHRNLQRNARPMLRAFLCSTVIFGLIAVIKHPTYKAESVLMVRLGQEYLVNGDPASTTMYMERREIVASEAGMLQTPQLALQVIAKMGLARLYPGIAEDMDVSDRASVADATERAVLKFQSDLSVLPVKDSTLLDVTLKNHDPVVAADALRLTVESYLQDRKKHFEYGNGEALDAQIRETGHVLEQSTSELLTIKRQYGITDIDKQIASLFDEQSDLTHLSNEARLDAFAQMARIRVLAPTVAAMKPVVLQTTTRDGPGLAAARGEAAKLSVQRDELLVSLKPRTPQIQDLDHEILLNEWLRRSYIQDQDTQTVTGRPAALDPLEVSLAQAQAQLAASNERQANAAAKIADIRRRIAELDGQRAQYDQKFREQHAAQDAFFQASKRVSEARAHDQMMDAAKPNVEVVEAARPPYKETPLRLIIAIAGVLLGVMLAGTILYLDNVGRGWRPSR